MFYLMAPSQFVVGKFATRQEAEKESKKRKSDPRHDFFTILEARDDRDARVQAKAFYEYMERATGHAWKN